MTETATNIKEKLELVKKELGVVIKGKPGELELMLIAILADGHVLLEDMPGVGKTTLAKALSKALDMKFTRIQFTPDLLPSDLLGMSILNPRDGTFAFNEGPVFTNLLLADEINRASPRTQSALLEAMNEGQVSIDNATRKLESPFLVVATQNPIEYQGTYPLPEAQLDRFLLRLSLGYPGENEEMQILFDRQTEDPLDAVKSVLSKDELLWAQKQVMDVTVEEDVARYILRIIESTRNHGEVQIGASPRASLALFRASQSKAYVEGRNFVTPSDVQSLCEPVLGHRIALNSGAKYGGTTTGGILSEILSREKVPV